MPDPVVDPVLNGHRLLLEAIFNASEENPEPGTAGWIARNIVVGDDGHLRCLACAGGDHHTCYGTSCWCECQGAGVE